MSKILVIEDDRNKQNLLSNLVGLAGFQPICADSAKIGLEMVQRHHPDLILSDINMPAIDGYTFLTFCQSSQTATIPLISLNSQPKTMYWFQSQQLSADNCLNPVANVTEWADSIRKQISQ